MSTDYKLDPPAARPRCCVCGEVASTLCPACSQYFCAWHDHDESHGMEEEGDDETEEGDDGVDEGGEGQLDEPF